MTQTFELTRVPSPIDGILIVTDAQGRLRALEFEHHSDRMMLLLDRHYGKGQVRLAQGPGPGELISRLADYFAGHIAAVDAIPTATGGTDFQRRVWQALRGIPAGQTWSYRRLAEHIGKPGAVRAVGLANGANPISIVVPCHRVIGSNGSLTGYSGGVERKRWLLELEGALPQRSLLHA